MPTTFPDHTLDTAPTGARRAMQATEARLGYLPAPVARMATSPELLDGFLRLSGIFEATTLDPLSRETVILTMATRNDCHVCIAMHTATLQRLGADPEVITALRSAQPIPDERLDAVRVFTLAVLATAGAVGHAVLDSFLAHGYTARNALEVVLGVGAYTMSTLANRLTDAPLDPQLQPFSPLSSR